MPERKYEYRRHLPHLQADKPLFISFCTHRRWKLPHQARDAAFQSLLQGNGRKFRLHAFVVMPDHVHLALTPLADDKGHFSISEIMQGIKGASAHRVNKIMQRKGPVWQEESFDHVPRSYESLEAEVEYMRQNPVRAGVVEKAEDYPWFWEEERMK